MKCDKVIINLKTILNSMRPSATSHIPNPTETISMEQLQNQTNDWLIPMMFALRLASLENNR